MLNLASIKTSKDCTEGKGYNYETKRGKQIESCSNQEAWRELRSSTCNST